MKKIEHPGDWGSHSAVLDGKKLFDGEVIIVRWPDGFLEQIAVTIERTLGSVMDHGHESSTVCDTAYYIAQHRGVRVVVPLDGLDAQRT